ncbi:aspartyl protease family protein [Sphingomonas bacterium]|uniref:aspartyl protease family protein n=1 Tax=Sphingomonas bacterium TaxID=1895847 RepID=UPI0020C6A306|nr:aspartyl protease family protein [Sphingomonas bacterium]
MRGLAKAWSGVLGLLGLMTAGPAVAACTVARAIDLPVTLVGERAMVAARFGPHDARFIVDSGAFYSTLSQASAAGFGLSSEPAPAWFRLRGINGDASVSITKAKDFSLAGIRIPAADFIVGGSDTGSAGLLGQNILGLADTEYDFPHGAVRLMRVEGCGKVALAYWSAGRPFSTIPLERGGDGPWKPHTIGTVLVNGVRMRAVFDSGAQSTMMTLAAARRAGVTPASPGVTSVGYDTGLGSKRIAAWIAPFDRIDLGGEIVSRPRFRIADIQLDADMLVGFDFFLTHRMFVSNANHQLYMTYEGGPVFGLTPTGARTGTGEKLDLTDRAADPTDAEGFGRRGTVLMSKHRFAEGLADLDRAVTMAPNEGRYVYLRAQARLANGQPALAAADLDRAATLMPDDPDVRLSRARLRFTNHDPDGAMDDVKAADRILPSGSDRRLLIAGLYDGLDRPEPAIANYDAWLKMHGEDADRASAYNGRCWARALLNRDLDRALSDCNTALKLHPGDASYLDSRALVQLRRGRLDAALADYDAAVKANPRSAWSLYARAIAEKHAGRNDAAETDRKAALAIDPAVGKRAMLYGLEI